MGGAAPVIKGGGLLSGVLCASALACRFDDGFGKLAVFVFPGFRSLAGWTPDAAIAGCFGLEVADLVFGADLSLGVSLCATGA
jgi:hypothetical protein